MNPEPVRRDTVCTPAAAAGGAEYSGRRPAPGLCALLRWTLLVLAMPVLCGGNDVGDTLPVPRLWYRFETTTERAVRDASGHGHDGVFEAKSGALAEHLVRTQYGPALRLARGEGVRVRMTPDLACENGLTVMAWVRPDEVNRHLAVVAAKSDTVADQKAAGWRLSVFWRTAFGEVGLGDPAGVRITAPPFSVEAKHWVHLALTFDGTDLILYVNAAEVARKHFPEARRILPFRSRTFTIGKYFWRDAYPFTGLLADVRIYDRALAPDQVFRAAAEWLGPP